MQSAAPSPSPAPSNVDPKAVFVSNIAPSATEKTVSDFFSFCGKITRLAMRKGVGAGGTHEATVHFETESAAKTALLLTNALIVDRPISVVPYVQPVEAQPAPATETVQQGAEISNKEFAVPDEQRTKTSVVASLLAAGYTLGTDSFAKAKEYDENHHISQQLKAGAEAVKNKVVEIDKQYKISETATNVANATTQKIREVDAQYNISSTAAETAKAVDQKLNISGAAAYIGSTWNAGAAYIRQASIDLANKPTVQATIQTIQQVTAPVGKTLEEIEQETARLIAEKQRQNAPPGGEAAPAPAAAGAPPAAPAPAQGPAMPAAAQPPAAASPAGPRT